MGEGVSGENGNGKKYTQNKTIKNVLHQSGLKPSHYFYCHYWSSPKTIWPEPPYTEFSHPQYKNLNNFKPCPPDWIRMRNNSDIGAIIHANL